MRRLLALLAALALLGPGIAASADVFNLGAGFANLKTVGVGNPGNTGDFRYGTAYQGGGPASYGSVGYYYSIGEYEVTAMQYADFLNHKAKVSDPYGLYNANMMSTYGCRIQRTGTAGNYTYSVSTVWANRPVNYVSCWDACRFANWLHNGQGTGDTEHGAYNLGGYNGPDSGGVQRSGGWKWAVTSEDEWYKAAYYDPEKPGGAGYWDYPTMRDTAPGNQLIDPDPGNQANYRANNDTIGSPYYRTNVGEFENSASAYGTFDQGGNVWEWNEGGGTFRGLRGSSFMNDQANFLSASSRSCYFDPTTEGELIGFRVSSAVPEPSSVVALAGGFGCLLPAIRRRPYRRYTEAAPDNCHIM